MSDTRATVGRLRLVPMTGRSRAEVHRAATPFELFFDLVFVVAISLASESLHELGVMSRQVVFDSADGRGSDRGVVPVMIVEVQPARECFAALSL